MTYSDQPPPAQQSKQLNLGTGPQAPAQRSAVELDKELEKSRLEAQEKAKLAENAAKKKQLDEENCNRAKAYLQHGDRRRPHHDDRREGRARSPRRPADRGRAGQGAEGRGRGLQGFLTKEGETPAEAIRIP